MCPISPLALRELPVILADARVGAMFRSASLARQWLVLVDKDIASLPVPLAVILEGQEALDPIVIPSMPSGFSILVGLASGCLGVASSSATVIA